MSVFGNNVSRPILTQHNLSQWKGNVMDKTLLKRIGLILLGFVSKHTKGSTQGFHTENVFPPYDRRL